MEIEQLEQIAAVIVTAGLVAGNFLMFTPWRNGEDPRQRPPESLMPQNESVFSDRSRGYAMNASLSNWPRIALMTGSWSPRTWTRPVCCFLNWIRSGPYIVTSSSVWKCVSVTAAVFDHPAHGAAGALIQCASQLMYRTEQLSRN